MKIIKDWSVNKRDQTAGALPVHAIRVEHVGPDGATLRDSKSRAIGGGASIVDRRSLNPPEGQRFELELETLRDGRKFGALRPSSWFPDLDKAKREAIKRLERQGKGFARSHGGAK